MHAVCCSCVPGRFLPGFIAGEGTSCTDLGCKTHEVAYRPPRRLPGGSGADVWAAVCEVYIREKVMTIEAVRAEIPALGPSWSPPLLQDVGEEAMLKGEPPATEADVALLKEMLGRPGREGWLAACKEVYRVRRFSVELSGVIATILGATPEGEAVTIESGREYVALLAPLKAMPGLVDLLKAHGHLVEIVMGLVQRIDAIGGLVPIDFPKPEPAISAPSDGTQAAEPEIQVGFDEQLAPRIRVHLTPGSPPLQEADRARFQVLVAPQNLIFAHLI